MLEDKKLNEIKKRVTLFLADGSIKTKQPKEYVEFFLTNAQNSLDTAKAIYELSTNTDFQEYTGIHDLNGYLWVVNASYYSMFYAARALLANEGIKLSADLSVHSLTFDALVNFFYLNNKLQKKLLQSFVEAQEEASEILGQEKADALVTEYFLEKSKRAKLTYETGEYAIQSKAKTSLERAKSFNQEIRRIISTDF